MPRPGPSLALQLAQALASESHNPLHHLATRAEIRKQWRVLNKHQRRFWLRKARRVLARLKVVGPA